MNLSKDTLSIIKNFSTINTNLTLKKGSVISTISSGKNIMAQATVDETFPMDFPIYDLNEFLGAMSLFEDPSIDFNAKHATISQEKNSVKYFAANSAVMTVVPTLKAFPTPDITFNVSGQMLGQIQRVASILKAADFSIVGDGNVATISVGDKTNPTGNMFESEIGSTDKSFKVNMKVENLKVMNGDYTVDIGAKKISRFTSANGKLVYYIAIEADSTFDF